MCFPNGLRTVLRTALRVHLVPFSIVRTLVLGAGLVVLCVLTAWMPQFPVTNIFSIRLTKERLACCVDCVVMSFDDEMAVGGLP